MLIHKAARIELDTAPPSQATGPSGPIESADVLLDNSRYGTRYRLTAMSDASFADVTADADDGLYLAVTQWN